MCYQDSPLGIQHFNSSEFSIDWSTFKILLLIWLKLPFLCNVHQVLKYYDSAALYDIKGGISGVLQLMENSLE